MRWTSLQELIGELKLETPHTYDNLKRQIIQRIRRIHPDSNGGTFREAGDQAALNVLTAALTAIELFANTSSNDQLAIVTTDHNGLGFAIPLPATPPSPRNDTAQICRHASVLAETTKKIQTHYLAPKITSVAIGTVLAMLATFGDKLKDNEMWGPIFSTPLGRVGVASLAIVAAGFYALTWRRERRESALIEYFLSETGQGDILRRLVYSKRRRAKTELAMRVTVAEMADQIQMEFRTIAGDYRRSHWYHGLARLLPRIRISDAEAERLGLTQLAALEYRGALTRSLSASVSTSFDVPIAVERELLPADPSDAK